MGIDTEVGLPRALGKGIVGTLSKVGPIVPTVLFVLSVLDVQPGIGGQEIKLA
jgi:hypothetical protein